MIYLALITMLVNPFSKFQTDREFNVRTSIMYYRVECEVNGYEGKKLWRKVQNRLCRLNDLYETKFNICTKCCHVVTKERFCMECGQEAMADYVNGVLYSEEYYGRTHEALTKINKFAKKYRVYMHLCAICYDFVICTGDLFNGEKHLRSNVVSTSVPCLDCKGLDLNMERLKREIPNIDLEEVMIDDMKPGSRVRRAI